MVLVVVVAVVVGGGGGGGVLTGRRILVPDQHNLLSNLAKSGSPSFAAWILSLWSL